MGDADPNAGGNHGHNVNQPMGSDFWTSTGKHCWDKAMKEYGHAFDQIGLEDLEGDNSLLILTLYVENVTTSPPTQKRGHGPYAAATVAKTMEHFINRICEKLFAPGQREQKKNELFPSAEVKVLKKRDVKTILAGFSCREKTGIVPSRLSFLSHGNIMNEQGYSNPTTYQRRSEGRVVTRW